MNIRKTRLKFNKSVQKAGNYVAPGLGNVLTMDIELNPVIDACAEILSPYLPVRIFHAGKNLITNRENNYVNQEFIKELTYSMAI